ncbi:MAG: hypothetical protein H7319_01605 [Spirosoma sp.]|nr:hypothetical protein [Spirosoma sp.]
MVVQDIAGSGIGASLALAKWLLPAHNQTYVNGIAQVLPLLEIGVMGYVAWHGAAVLRAHQTHRQSNPDFVVNLQQSLTDVTEQPKLSQLIASEAAHMLVARWSAEGAWLLTAVSLYSLLFIVAETVVTVQHPTYLDGQTLHLRFGLRWRVVVSRNNIKRIERINETPPKHTNLLTGPILVQPNVLLTLCEPVMAEGMYGITKSVRQVEILVDEPDKFAALAE